MLAITTKDIKFEDFDEQWVVIKEGTDIYVDPEEGIAYAEGYHFDIEKHEYSVLN